ncbi:MAG: hypothetical protein UY07_C0006G0004 [Parcubacteria group bacterium GW2011_GWA1_47_8]|nr:MAG: hypothetical protein UY07_C0006G0004 [Parcubacteria group bacterium GW2011_GWA1_47_8]
MAEEDITSEVSGDVDITNAFDLNDDDVDLGDDSVGLLSEEDPVPGFVSRSFED